MAAALWGVLGFGGAVYPVIAARRMRRQTAYQPVFEDSVTHHVLAGTRDAKPGRRRDEA